MRFEFATAGRIVFGPGTVLEAAPAARELGSRVLLVAGRSPDRLAALGDLACLTSRVEGEPTVDWVRDASARAREERCDVVVACGGGSVIDAGKALAALLANPGGPLDYLEVIGKGGALERPPVPFIAIPTTAGTGSEVTRNAVLASPEMRVKASLRSPLMLPRLAIVDPELTLSVPPAVTAATGLDALTQLIEPYVSLRANAMTDMYCLEGMRRAARSLRRAFRDGSDRSAREDMAFASLMGGLALANAGLGVVHGFAAPVGGMFPAPHGAVCAALLPCGMDVNVRALRARAAASQALERYGIIGRVLTGNPGASADDGIAWVRDTCAEFGIPPLRNYGVTEYDAAELVPKAARASSMRGNPIALTEDEMREVLLRATL